MIDPRQVSVPSQGKNSVELRRGLALPSPYSSFPSPCGERVLLNPAILETLSYLVFKVRSRINTEQLLNKQLQLLVVSTNHHRFLSLNTIITKFSN